MSGDRIFMRAVMNFKYLVSVTSLLNKVVDFYDRVVKRVKSQLLNLTDVYILLVIILPNFEIEYQM